MWNNSFPGNTCLNDPSSYWIKPGDNTKVLWEHSRRRSWLQCFDIIYFCWTTWQLYKDVFHLFLLEHAHTDTSCEKRYNIVCMVAERLDATPKPPEIQPNIIFILVLTKVFLSLFFFFLLWAVMMTILFFGAVCASFFLLPLWDVFSDSFLILSSP